ncbi:MAG: LysM peptidoglycan-binding domain-containing protein [Acidobacteria bacterium]|nr:LysM peptidoglycan-binding domain-containing protein [Acidobacteriota bacterium]
MIGRRFLVVAGVLALASCRSAVPTANRLPEPLPAITIAAPSERVEPTIRDRVDAYLDAARDAVVSGGLEEFASCHSATLLALESDPTRGGSDPGWIAGVLDELDRLGAQFDEDDGDEIPPEPEAVTSERVLEVQAHASTERFDLPVLVNPEVTSLIEFYTGRNRERFTAALERAARYLPFIRAEMRSAGIPEDLAYLPLVESAFNPRAKSRARAQGMWQFMAATGRLYDLRADGLIDERNDPFLSTRAAVRHLRDLNEMFGSWELALAAYNSGAGRVQRAIKRSHGVTDFWTLRRFLPRETRNYVPALWAALIVAKDPVTYDLPVFPDSALCQERVAVEGALDLDVLAEHGGFDSALLADLNPALIRGITPVRGSYQLAVPCGHGDAARETIALIPPSERVKRFLHVVKRGDTPSAIARRYGSTVDAILSANKVKSARALRIGQTLIVPRGGSAARPTRARVEPRGLSSQSRSARRAASRPSGDSASPDRYVVRRGDTLFAIARRFRTSADELQKLNRLPSSRITPGDSLIVGR